MKKTISPLSIIFGMLAGFLFAFIHVWYGWDPEILNIYVLPFGKMFLNALKLIALPLTMSSIILGVNSAGTTSRLSRMGALTIFLYLMTTCSAVCFGLLLVYLLKPGSLFGGILMKDLPAAMPQPEIYAGGVKDLSKALANFIPENLFAGLSNNHNFLQLVFFSVLVGVTLLHLNKSSRKMMVNMCTAINDVFISLSLYVMRLAPIGVFALIAPLLAEKGSQNSSEIYHFVLTIGAYSLTVVAGLSLMLFVVYPSLVFFFSRISVLSFFRAIRPAQLLAFSTSSSSACLPFTIKQVESLGVPSSVSGFVLPLGATINMDGTSIYQAIAVVFIAQVYGLELGWLENLTIIIYVTVASIGIAGAPGASLSATSILLNILGIPIEGISLIAIPDRLLDMYRTAVNVTGDAAVATIVANQKVESKPPGDSKTDQV